MRFMMFMIPKVYQPDTPPGERAGEGFAPPAEAVAKMMKFNEELAKAGALISLDGLHPISKGARVSFSRGKPKVTEGHLIKAKEVIGGYWMIEVKSKEDAIEWAKRVPAEDGDVIEIRQVFEASDFPPDKTMNRLSSGVEDVKYGRTTLLNEKDKIKDKVTASISINAPIAEVWDALTNPKIIKLYLFGADVTTDWKEESPIFFRGNWHGKPYEDKGKVIKIVPRKLLRYSYWSSSLGLPDLPENYTITTYELKEENNKTLLSATQDNLASQPQQVHDYAETYWENLLRTLKELLEKI